MAKLIKIDHRLYCEPAEIKSIELCSNGLAVDITLRSNRVHHVLLQDVGIKDAGEYGTAGVRYLASLVSQINEHRPD